MLSGGCRSLSGSCENSSEVPVRPRFRISSPRVSEMQLGIRIKKATSWSEREKRKPGIMAHCH
jgi:hypothetical protein